MKKLKKRPKGKGTHLTISQSKGTHTKKRKDSEIFVDEFGKYLNELTDEEIVEFLEDMR